MLKKLINKITSSRNLTEWHDAFKIVMDKGNEQEQSQFKELCENKEAFFDTGRRIVAMPKLRELIKQINSR